MKPHYFIRKGEILDPSPLCRRSSVIHPDDNWEKSRIDERLFFAIDIGSGANKIVALGCDMRGVSDLKCDAHALPFKDNCFIIAVLRHVLEHIKDDWKKVLSEAERVASIVYVFHPHQETWHLDKSHIDQFNLPSRYRKLRSYFLSDLFCFRRELK